MVVGLLGWSLVGCMCRWDGVEAWGPQAVNARSPRTGLHRLAPILQAGSGRYIAGRPTARTAKTLIRPEMSRNGTLHYTIGTVSPASMTSPINGSNGKRAWRVVALVAILAVVIGTTAGELWHRHVNCSPETCPICHLSHQVVELPVAAASTQILVPAGRQTEPPRPTVIARFVVSHLPARAPPAWR